MPTPQAARGGGLGPRLAKSRQAADGVPVSPAAQSGDFSRLVDRFKGQESVRVEAAYRDVEQRSPDRVSQTASRTSSPGREAAPGETTGSASAGELWGRIEPFWRSLSARVERPVTLEVSLDGLAGLSRPPTVVRDAGAMLDEPRLRAEARALQALAGCLPRGELRFARRVYRLEFTAEP